MSSYIDWKVRKLLVCSAHCDLVPWLSGQETPGLSHSPWPHAITKWPESWSALPTMTSHLDWWAKRVLVYHGLHILIPWMTSQEASGLSCSFISSTNLRLLRHCFGVLIGSITQRLFKTPRAPLFCTIDAKPKPPGSNNYFFTLTDDLCLIWIPNQWLTLMRCSHCLVDHFLIYFWVKLGGANRANHGLNLAGIWQNLSIVWPV